MRHTRCSISGLMAVVLLVAFDCAAVRSPLSGRPPTNALLLLGALPMANILAVGLLPLLREHPGRRGRRPWLVGFEGVGWATLLLYACGALSHPEALRSGVVFFLRPLRFLGNTAFHAAAAAAFSLPQISLALVGGWLNRRYKVPWPSLAQDRHEVVVAREDAMSEA